MVKQEDPELTSCQGHTKITTTYKATCSSAYQQSRSFTTKYIKKKKKKPHPEGQEGHRQSWEPNLQHDDPQAGGMSQAWRSSLRSEGIKPHPGHPRPCELASRRVPTVSGSNNQQGLTPGKPDEPDDYRNQDCSQRAMALHRLGSDPTEKQQFENVLGSI